MEMVFPMEGSSKGKGAVPRGPRGPGENDWIRNQLKRVYDTTIREDIPSEMLDLLRQLDDVAAVLPAESDDAAEDRDASGSGLSAGGPSGKREDDW